MPAELAVHTERWPQAIIANITDQRYLPHRMYGTFQVAARAEGEEFALTRITPRVAVMDYGDKRTLPLQITAHEIAEDICREINSDAGERSYLGVFVCAGEAPTEDELRAANEKLEEFYRSLVAAADREWQRSHSHLFLNDLQRQRRRALASKKSGITRRAKCRSAPGVASASSRASRCANRAAQFWIAREGRHARPDRSAATEKATTDEHRFTQMNFTQLAEDEASLPWFQFAAELCRRGARRGGSASGWASQTLRSRK